MAARRIRIKGIANIPQRRKGSNGNQSDGIEPSKLVEETEVNDKNSSPNQTSDYASKCEKLQVITGSSSPSGSKSDGLELSKLVDKTEVINDKKPISNQTSDNANKSENLQVPACSNGNQIDGLEPNELVEQASVNNYENVTIKHTSNHENQFENLQVPAGSSSNESDGLKPSELVEKAEVSKNENAVPNQTSDDANQSENLSTETQNDNGLEVEPLQSIDANSAGSNLCQVQEFKDRNTEKPDNLPETTSVQLQEKSCIKQPFRRRFLKPVITKVILNRTAKHKVENDAVIKEEHTNKENTELPKETPKCVHFELDNLQNNDEAQENKVIQSLTNDSAISGSDTENVPAPPSPSKINRLRIKAVPRFGQRRTSFSASESEDDNKKNYNRHRNDSVCSTASGTQDNICSGDVPPTKKELNTVMQRKWKRTEQSRKLAEARREFIEKFKDSKPDRQKLTMMDLIFYNPTTNPMSYKRKRKDTATEESKGNDVDESKENVMQEIKPNENNEQTAEEDDDGIPAPQIKIGPNGEIIVDEKSLVIENKEVKKNLEAIQKSSLIDGDLDTSYGVYKRVKRSKDWTREETICFYKALNTIGTDFSLMCELFPRRTRRELKMKFKKEERINRVLIDKALMQPTNFDISHLKHEMELEERTLAEMEKIKKEKQELANSKVTSKRNKKMPFIATEIKQQSEDETSKCKKPSNESPPDSTKSSPNDANKTATTGASDARKYVNSDIKKAIAKKRKQKKSIPKSLRKGVNSFLENSDADDESDASSSSNFSEHEDSDSSDSVIKIIEPQPTRSGRIPKVRQPDIEMPIVKRRRTVKKPVVKTEEETPQIEPGSVVIFTSVGPNGEPVYNVYMVTPGQDKTPLNLNSEIISNLTKSLGERGPIHAQNLLTISAHENVPVEENNVTIPATPEDNKVASEITNVQ